MEGKAYINRKDNFGRKQGVPPYRPMRYSGLDSAVRSVRPQCYSAWTIIQFAWRILEFVVLPRELSEPLGILVGTVEVVRRFVELVFSGLRCLSGLCEQRCNLI